MYLFGSLKAQVVRSAFKTEISYVCHEISYAFQITLLLLSFAALSIELSQSLPLPLLQARWHVPFTYITYACQSIITEQQQEDDSKAERQRRERGTLAHIFSLVLFIF